MQTLKTFQIIANDHQRCKLLVNAKNIDSKTPLHIAIEYGRLINVCYFILFSGDVEIVCGLLQINSRADIEHCFLNCIEYAVLSNQK
jgi:hypothetical protein